MPIPKVVHLPRYITSATPEIMPPYDSCFVPAGFLFPESRAELAPYREFPLSQPFYSQGKQDQETSRDRSIDDILAAPRSDDSGSSAFDSTILQISELDELLLDVQSMGMQYTLHTQMCLRVDLSYEFPSTWDRVQAMLMNIPVFSEEICQWHYPISTMGYNVANIDPPMDIDAAHNYPQLFGYLPNGDLAVYWEIAEELAAEFNIDIEPLHSTVNGTLVLLPGIAEQVKALAHADSVVETGVVVNPGRDSSEVEAIASQWLGRKPLVLRSSMYQFYRINLPVIHCELDFNSYGVATWGAFGFKSPCLSGFEFKVNNNPFSRTSPIFSTERGNIVVTRNFYKRLRELVLEHGGNFTSVLFPVQRIP